MKFREPLDRLVRYLPPPEEFRFPPADQIRLYDTTLRDGEQTPGVAFSPEQKYELARLLSHMGLHILDVGFPAAAESDRRSLQRIIQGKQRGEIRPDLEVLVMCRANRRDIALTAATLREIDVDPGEVTFFTFTSGSDLHIKYKLGQTLLRWKDRPVSELMDTPMSFFHQANRELLADAVQAAREEGVRVIEFGGEDGSRADMDYYVTLLQAGLDAGATRIGFPDTVGCLTPEGVDRLVKRLVDEFPRVPVVIHFHNDLGLGAINTVRALAQGVTTVAVTANGLGERAGNAPLHQVVMILRELYGIEIPGFRYDLLPELTRLVERFSGIPVSAYEPIIGDRVFTHESGIHTAGMLRDRRVYQFIDPVAVGRKIRYRFGKHSGTAAVQYVLGRNADRLRAAGIEPDQKLAVRVTAEVKRLREEQCSEGITDRAVHSYRQALGQLGLDEEGLVRHVLERYGRVTEDEA